MDCRAYTEAYVLIDNLSDDLKKKVPERIIDGIKSKMDKSYEFKIQEDDDGNIEDIELLEDTEKILSVIYTDYLATEEEKVIIKNKQYALWVQEENSKKINYSNDLFDKKINQEQLQHTELTIIPKGTWYNKLINLLKKIFK